MLQAFLTESGFIIEEVDMPTPRDNEVLVKLSSCSICNVDIFNYRSAVQGQMGDSSLRLALGHEGSGVIESIGVKVGELEVGDQVTIDGVYRQDEFSRHFAEYVVAPADALVAVDSSIPINHALGEPLSCGVYAIDKTDIQPGASVAVLGAGFMGLVCMQLANLAGADSCTVFDLFDLRLDTAKKLGATTVMSVSEAERIEEIKNSFDVVIEAAGNQAALNLATHLVGEHGTITIVGYHQSHKGTRNINIQKWNSKALTVINGHVRKLPLKIRAMEQAMKLLEEEKLALDLIVKDYQFRNIEQAFQDLLRGSPGLYKANLVFG